MSGTVLGGGSVGDHLSCRVLSLASPTQVYPAGIELFRQGVPPQEAIFISNGLVKLVHLAEDGKEVIIGLRTPGWFLGSAAIVSETVHTVTASTVTICQLQRIPAANLQYEIERDAEFCRQMLTLYARELQNQFRKLAEHYSLCARQRLEQFFWDFLAAQTGSPGPEPVRLQLPVKLTDVAQLIAVTPTHLSRLLKQLDEDGLVRRNKGWFHFHSPQRLWHHTTILDLVGSAAIARSTSR